MGVIHGGFSAFWRCPRVCVSDILGWSYLRFGPSYKARLNFVKIPTCVRPKRNIHGAHVSGLFFPRLSVEGPDDKSVLVSCFVCDALHLFLERRD